VIAALAFPAALAAKAATATIAIVFEMSGNPIQPGLVASLNRPGGNVTGVANLNVEVEPKRVDPLARVDPQRDAQPAGGKSFSAECAPSAMLIVTIGIAR
jgi:hypothetical protein